MDIFTLSHEPLTISTFTDDSDKAIAGSVVFKLDQNRYLIHRSVYSLLDYLGDIGGLFGIFSGLASLFSLIMNFNGVYHLLTSSLFRVQTDFGRRIKKTS